MGKYRSLWTEYLNLCIIQYKTTPPTRARSGRCGGDYFNKIITQWSTSLMAADNMASVTDISNRLKNFLAFIF